MLNSAFKNIIIAKKLQKLEDTDVIDVISKQVKQRAESIDQFKKGNRQDLVDKETKELDILKTYLPEQMGEEELTKLAQDTIKEVGATGKQDMGKVMKAIMPKAKGRCDSKLLSEIVGKCLN